MQAGFLGLGAMGAPMARQLAKASLLAGAWNRTRSRGEAALQHLNVPLAEAPETLAHCPILFLSLSDDDAVEQLVHRLLPHLERDTLIVDTSTTAPATAEALAEACRARGVRFVDAPVSGGVDGAGAGALVMFLGAARATLPELEPALAALTTHTVFLGRAGQGQAAKAVNQVLVAGINQAVTEGLAFAEALGLPGALLRPALERGMAGSRLLERRGASLQAGDFEPGFRLALHHKDLVHAKALAHGLGAQLPIVEMTLIHYRRLMAEGAGDQDITALYRQKQRLFP